MSSQNTNVEKSKQPPTPTAPTSTIYARAKEIKRIHRVAALGNTWLVSSGTRKNAFYVVQYDQVTNALRCECKAFEFNQQGICKHILAVADHEQGRGITN